MIQAAVEASPSRCITMSMRSRPSSITTNAVSALMFASESVTRAPHAHACAGVGNQEVATMNSRPRQIRRAFFTRIRILGGQIKFDQEPVRGMWRKRPRAGDVDVSASKVSLLEVPAMAISSATPGSGCGRTC